MPRARRNQVWAIEQGQYSSYHIVGVYSSKKNAQLVADLLNADDPWGKATVVAWTLDPLIEKLNAGLTRFEVIMRRDGTTENVYPRDIDACALDGDAYRIWHRSTAPAYRGVDIEDALQATVWAKDEEHAVKIVNERRTQMIATGKWK